jgi:hypothetical protein
VRPADDVPRILLPPIVRFYAIRQQRVSSAMFVARCNPWLANCSTNARAVPVVDEIPGRERYRVRRKAGRTGTRARTYRPQSERLAGAICSPGRRRLLAPSGSLRGSF